MSHLLSNCIDLASGSLLGCAHCHDLLANTQKVINGQIVFVNRTDPYIFLWNCLRVLPKDVCETAACGLLLLFLTVEGAMADYPWCVAEQQEAQHMVRGPFHTSIVERG